MAALVALLLSAFATPAAAKYAALIVDAETGLVLKATNADTRNHPASLTKMMTLYKVFQAVESGRWSLHTRLRISSRAARQPSSKLGLPAGQTISVRDAILALVIKSANDIATTVAENYSGQEHTFALHMTETARQLGMSQTTFRNASGLPHYAQLSTARDMAKLAHALMRDFPQHYHFFSEAEFTLNGVTHKTHNNLLLSYEGADGFKTGYIRASGFNLVTSAKRDGKRLIGVIFGGKTSGQRNFLMAKYLDKGFEQLSAGRTVVASAQTKPQSNKLVPHSAVSDEEDSGDAKPRTFDKNNRWGIQVGAFVQQEQAKKTAIKAVATLPQLLEDGVPQIVPLKKRNGRVLHRARVYGLSKQEAYQACKLLEQHNIPCMELRGPEALEIAGLTREG
ncbi:MAG: D-alanyl-D-alanine carboxypeptidase [Rhodospirillaceae bacterium]